MSEEQEFQEDNLVKKQQGTIKGFGISDETKDSNISKMLPPVKIEPNKTFPGGYKFPISHLVNVTAKDEFETKNGKTQVLQFIFKDKEGRQHIHTEWAQDPDDEKYETKIEGLNSRVKHIYTQLKDWEKGKKVGTNATNFFEYFQALENEFKAIEGFSKIPMFTKLVYYNNNLNFPLNPNFLQRAGEGSVCKLEINLKYDTIEQSASASPKLPGVPSGGEDIDFDEEYA